MPVDKLPYSPTLRATAHENFCVAVRLETAACFGVVGLILAMGTVYMPLFLWGALVEGEVYSRGAAAMVALGWGGLAAVIRLLYLVCHRATYDSWRSLTLLGLALGCAAVLYKGFEMWQGWSPGGIIPLTLMTWMPLLCTLHLCFLARRPLFCRSTEHDIA